MKRQRLWTGLLVASGALGCVLLALPCEKARSPRDESDPARGVDPVQTASSAAAARPTGPPPIVSTLPFALRTVASAPEIPAGGPRAAAPSWPEPEGEKLAAAALRALDSEDYSVARALARACLDANPADAECNHALVWSFTRVGEHDEEARVAVADCLNVDPNDTGCLESAIALALLDHDASRARELLAQRLSVPGAGPDLVDEGAIDEMAGDVVSACIHYSRACEQGQEFACKQTVALRC